SKIDPDEPMFTQSMETSFFSAPGKVQLLEYNWDYQPATSFVPWRPLYFLLRTGGTGAGDALDTAEFQFKTCSTCSTARFTRWGSVEIGEFVGSSSNVLTVRKTIPTSIGSLYGTQSILDLQLNASSNADAEYVGSVGEVTWS